MLPNPTADPTAAKIKPIRLFHSSRAFIDHLCKTVSLIHDTLFRGTLQVKVE